MKPHAIQGSAGTPGGIRTRLHSFGWERAGVLYARLALGSAFLSAVASRFGLWDKTVDLDHFQGFIHYTAEVNAFLPVALIPAVAWAATIAETSCGILLIAGIWLRGVSLASAVLLALFGLAMTISSGAKSPMDYSVFSASSGATLLALYEWHQDTEQTSKHKMKGTSA